MSSETTLLEIKELLQAIDRKTTAYMSAKLQLIGDKALEREHDDVLRDGELTISLKAIKELDK